MQPEAALITPRSSIFYPLPVGIHEYNGYNTLHDKLTTKPKKVVNCHRTTYTDKLV